MIETNRRRGSVRIPRTAFEMNPVHGDVVIDEALPSGTRVVGVTIDLGLDGWTEVLYEYPPTTRTKLNRRASRQRVHTKASPAAPLPDRRQFKSTQR